MKIRRGETMFPKIMGGMCETDWLEVGKDIKEILKSYKNELRL